jgi:hypothetical protein
LDAVLSDLRPAATPRPSPDPALASIRSTMRRVPALHAIIEIKRNPCVYRKPNPGLSSEESAMLAR